MSDGLSEIAFDESPLFLRRPQTVLSLYDYSGVWSKPYRDDGYNVVQVDLKRDGMDVRLMTVPNQPIHGILAAPRHSSRAACVARL